MQIDFLNIDEICKDLPAVTSNKIYVRKDFHNEGLFSQQIFGPVKNYTCGCGNYMGRSKIGTVCNICEVEIAHSNERRKRFAKIVLPFPVMNPIMYFLLAKIGKVSLKDVMWGSLFSETIHGYFWDDDKAKFMPVTDEIPAPSGKTIYSGLDGIYEITKMLATEHKEDNPDWKFVYVNLDKFYMQNVLVIPPAFRPTSKTKDVQKRDQLNDMILTILNFTLTKNEELLESNKDQNLYAINVRNLQKYIFDMYNFILAKFSKKSGIIRDSILGKRIDFSGRAVITPDPTLELDYCRVPYIMLLELYKLEIANALYEQRKVKTFASAISYIDECIKTTSLELFPIVKKVCTGRYMILNRQPTLHRMGILSFKVIPNTETVIQIHPMACEPFNADFDGDQMAIYRALYPDAEQECEEKLLLSKNLLSPTTGDLITGVNQDIVLGLYLATKDGQTPNIEIALIKLSDKYVIVQIDHLKSEQITQIKKKCKSWVATTQGRFKFLKCLPFAYQKQFLLHKKEFESNFNKPITKHILTKLLNDIARVYPNEINKTLDKVKKLGFQETTSYGSTISLLGMKLPQAEEISASIFDDKKLTIGKKITKLKSPEVMKMVKENFAYSDFIDSGSRGSWDQARQIILARGFVADSQGDIVEEPIRNNYVNGLTRDEFFNSSYGTRKGLLDTALNTGVSGYLTRKTVYSTANLELDYNNEDCGTTDTLKILIPEKDEDEILSLKFARALVGRYHIIDGKTEVITLANYYKFAKVKGGMRVNLRSPVFCKSRGVCLKCYGQNSEIVRSKYIGIIAAQALGEIGTQLVMRTFHTSGVAQDVGKNKGDKQEDIISDLTSVRDLLHCNDQQSYDRLVLSLYKIYSKHRNVMLVHFECIVSQMMRVGKLRWRLIKNRHDYEPEVVSILSVPQRESWLLALAFHKPKDYIIDGILRPGRQDGVLERIMTNQKI